MWQLQSWKRPIMSYHSLPQRCIATSLLLTNLLIAMLPMSFASVEERATPQVTATRLCLPHQSSALLRFKQSVEACLEPDRLSSWSDNVPDCCKWEGVTCDSLTGFVIAVNISGVIRFNCHVGSIPSSLFELEQLRHLDLSDNSFNGTIPSSLFELEQLRHLDLSDNYFNGTIPNRLGELTHLNLAFNHFSGQVPVELSQLTRLVYLNLKMNHFNGTIPKWLGELTHLTILSLAFCDFSGQVPVELSQLTRLVFLNLGYNSGRLQLQEPNYRMLVQGLVQLQELLLDEVIFSRRDMIAALSSSSLRTLQRLSLSRCNIGPFDNTELFQFPSLSYLDLAGNNLQRVPKFLENLTSLNKLRLSDCGLQGKFPENIFLLPKLETLDISNNEELVVSFPTEDLARSVNIRDLDLSSIKELADDHMVPSNPAVKPQVQAESNGTSKSRVTIPAGLIPKGVCLFPYLTSLTLENNSLNGTIPTCLFNIPSMKDLYLGNNKFSGWLPKFNKPNSNLEKLSLDNNLLSGDISSFLKKLTSLKFVDLSSNDFTDTIDYSLLSSLQNLIYLDASNNKRLRVKSSSYSTIDAHGTSFNLSQLEWLNLSSCSIQSFPKSICQLQTIAVLDLSDSDMEGKIPSCLWNISGLLGLFLDQNKLDGFQEPVNATSIDCNMEVLDLNDNFLTGKIPKSFSNCTQLKALDLGNNELEDTFPSWLGELNRLKVLILRSNHLYGPIPAFASPQVFPALTILDISNNHFSGNLSHELFEGLKTMMYGGPKDLSKRHGLIFGSDEFFTYPGHVEQTMKGKGYSIEEITWGTFNSIDLSNNKFSGRIPEELGRLKYLRGLNISNNHLDGPIPRSFGNLLQMEWLDLSHNRLSGAIPEELVALTFLSILNLSYNDLQGRIPHGNQFITFGASSFEGNPKLCGQQVNRECSDGHGQNDHKLDFVDEGKEIWQEGWKYGSVGIGFAVGLMTITLLILFFQRIANWYWDQTDGIVDYFVNLATNLCVSKFR